MRRRVPAFGQLSVLMLVVVLVVTACVAAPVATPASPVAGSAAPAGGDAPAAADGVKIILRVGTGDSGEGLTPHQEIITRFEQANPDILVQLEAVAGQDYYTRLLTQIAARKPPDLMQIGDDAVPMFVEREALVPLDEFITGADGLDTSIYLPGLLEPGQWQGRQWMLPKDYSPIGVYYNKKVFDQFGVPYPQDGWTWDDLLATAQALTKDTDGDGNTDVWGIQLPATWTSGFEYWVNAAGGSLISEDGTQFAGYMDSPAAQAALQFYSDLYNHYKVAPPPADLAMFGGGNTEFDNGQAAMRIFGRWPQAGYLENPNIELGVVGPPSGEVRANVLFWSGFGIAAATENREAAWRFLKFYAGPEGAEVWKSWALPAVASVAESSGLTTDPIEGVWIAELEHLRPRAYVFTPYWGQTADPALRQALETVLVQPGADVAAVLAQAASQAQTALDELLAENQ